MPAQYERRDSECEKWLQGLSFAQGQENARVLVRHAFNAGWAARKDAEFKAALGIDKSTEA